MTDTKVESAARFVGARARRKEDPRLLTGQGSYVGDIALPHMLHAAFVRSDYALARIAAIHLDRARELPGVRAVLTGDDLLEGIDLLPNWRGAILPTTAVSYVGEPIVLVLAESRAVAEDAVELVEIDYESLEPVIDLEEAITTDRRAHLGDESNIFHVDSTPGFGEIDEFLVTAPHVFTKRIDQHRYVHSPMEGRGVVAQWHSATQTMTVWFSTQGPHPAVAHFAQVLRLPQNAVRVIAEDVGGAFGQKIQVSREESSIPVAARLIGRPVKWIEDRYENLVAAPHARREFADVSVATDDEGHLLAIKVDHYQDSGSYGGPGLGMLRTLPGPYRFGRMEGRSCSVRTNTSSRGPYRGPWMMESVIREVMVDVVARGLDLDPLEVRRRNVIHRSDLPYTTVMGSTYDLITAEESLEGAVSMLDYEAFRKEQARARQEGRYIGVGISLFVEPTAGGASGLADGVSVRIDTSGSVLVSAGSGSQGHSVETTLGQIVADELGVDIESVKVVLGDTGSTPIGAHTGGSRNAVSGGNSAIKAASDLRKKVLEIAAEEFEASPEDLEIRHGAVSVVGIPARSKTLGEIARIASSSANLPEGMQPGLEMTGRFTTAPGFTWANACHVAVCEVDLETGKTTVLRFIVSEDCGVMINPNVVEGQIAGGVIQGISGVLYEHFIYDPSGNPVTTTYLDYLIATATEVPIIEYDHLETPAETNPGGFKGLGEGGAIGAPAAIMNAVSDALSPFGILVTDQPLTPPAVLELLERAGALT